MVAKDPKKANGSPKVEVGEIDTRAPFQSVKDAVSLFGEGAFSGEKPGIKKPKPHSAERYLAKETRLHLAEKELNKLKDQLKNAEATKTQALAELEQAKKTVDDLTTKLTTINESKESVINATEAAKARTKQLQHNETELNGGSQKHDLAAATEKYVAANDELDATKQELRKIRQDCESSAEAKNTALKQAAEAEVAANANMVRADELSKEIAAVLRSIEQAKLASVESKKELAELCSEKEDRKRSHKTALEDSERKLAVLGNEIDTQFPKNLENQLAETVSEIEAVKTDMEKAKEADLDSVRLVTSELDGAKESLHKFAEEEGSLRSLVESLKVELENVKKEHSELMEKDAETESVAGNLHLKLQKVKSELEAALAEESKVSDACGEMVATLNQLSSESETARREAEEMKRQAEELRKEAEATRMALEEAEKKLSLALEDAEEAKSAETRALDQIRVLSERTNAVRASTSESGAQITISREEYESVSRKVEESNKLAEMKVAAAMAQVEAVRASENEALKRLETTRKEIEEMKAATQEAVKKAEMAEAAKKAVEGELRRWREREQKKAADAASRILAETETSFDSSPVNYRIQQPMKVVESKKLERAKTSVSKKVLMPNLSGIFHWKRSHVEGGGSPSYLPVDEHI